MSMSMRSDQASVPMRGSRFAGVDSMIITSVLASGLREHAVRNKKAQKARRRRFINVPTFSHLAVADEVIGAPLQVVEMRFCPISRAGSLPWPRADCQRADAKSDKRAARRQRLLLPPPACRECLTSGRADRAVEAILGDSALTCDCARRHRKR